MKLVAVNRSRRRFPRRFLADVLKRVDRLAARELDSKAWRGEELVVAFVDQAEMRRLNKRYRGKNYATDVLSFEGEGLGELVICPDVIAKQAKEHGLTFREELAYMILHGFLHLLGYDHERSKKAAKEMFELQDRLFEKLLGPGT